MATKLFKFVLKSCVAGGLVYGTVVVTSRAWFAPHHSQSRYKENRSLYHYRETPIPSYQEDSHPEVLKETWNKGVKRLFHGLLVAPNAVKELSDKTYHKLKGGYNHKNQ